jgi:hypothetical protein
MSCFNDKALILDFVVRQAAHEPAAMNSRADLSHSLPELISIPVSRDTGRAWHLALLPLLRPSVASFSLNNKDLSRKL